MSFELGTDRSGRMKPGSIHKYFQFYQNSSILSTTGSSPVATWSVVTHVTNCVANIIRRLKEIDKLCTHCHFCVCVWVTKQVPSQQGSLLRNDVALVEFIYPTFIHKVRVTIVDSGLCPTWQIVLQQVLSNISFLRVFFTAKYLLNH